MTAREWSAATDLSLMLNALRGRVSDRKLRLFAVACCRHIWELLPDERSRSAVEVAEQYADGLASQRERGAARAAALGAAGRYNRKEAWAAYWTASYNLGESLWNACEAAVEATARAAASAAAGGTSAEQVAAWDAARAAGARHQTTLLREILGDPDRRVTVDPSWLTWNGGLVRDLARTVYDERRFEDLPIVADALEEAGCTDAALLAHCRSAAPHVRGCWALDILLGKE
ncbi:MAG TPA: hypothetical protein VEL76_16980 [Gemmataceae bacterium]|nr:hypothetical protein [Gemmataceae bacterium]